MRNVFAVRSRECKREGWRNLGGDYTRANGQHSDILRRWRGIPEARGRSQWQLTKVSLEHCWQCSLSMGSVDLVELAEMLRG